MRTLYQVTRQVKGKTYTEFYDETYEPLPDSETYKCECLLITEEQVEELKKEWENLLANKKEIVDIAGWKLRGNA